MKNFLQLKKNLKNDFSELKIIKVAILGDTATQFLTQALKGIDVIFIEIPTNRLSTYFNSTFLSNYENLMNKLGEHTQILRLDSSKFQKSNYRNIDHMNSSGAFIATKEIIYFLEKQ